MTDVLAVRVGYLKGTIKPEECPEQIDALSGRIQGIFHGQDGEYSPSTIGNVSGDLDQLICDRMGFPQNERHDAVRLFFHKLAFELLSVLAKSGTDTNGEMSVNVESNHLIETYQNILMDINQGDKT